MFSFGWTIFWAEERTDDATGCAGAKQMEASSNCTHSSNYAAPMIKPMGYALFDGLSKIDLHSSQLTYKSLPAVITAIPISERVSIDNNNGNGRVVREADP